MSYTDVLELGRTKTEIKGGMTAAAQALAYLGAAPLLAGALIAVAGADDLAIRAREAMIVYGAGLLIFFGGVRWGVAVMKPAGPGMRSLVGACLPMILAFPIMLGGDPYVRMAAIMALTFALLLDDLRATKTGSGAPQWYLGVRTPLTVLIEVAFLVAIVAALRA